MKLQSKLNQSTALVLTIKLSVVLAVALIVPAAASPQVHQPNCPSATPSRPGRYIVTDLGTLPGFVNSLVWMGGGAVINNRGHVAVVVNNSGFAYPLGDDSSFVWTGPGTTRILPALPGATDSFAMGMNDRDQVVGTSGFGNVLNLHGVLWSGGGAIDLGTFPGDDGAWATAINNRGDIVGLSGRNDFSIFRATIWHDLKIAELPSLPGAFFTQANWINDRGQSVGVSGPDWWADLHAVLWDDGTIKDLGTLGGVASYGSSINNASLIVGQAQTDTGDWHGCAWQKGAIIDLGAYESDPFCLAGAVNGRGQIVGMSGQGGFDYATAHALLWEDGVMIDLQTLIPADSGWVLQQAGGINDNGQIAGIGLHNGQLRSFLLTPSNHK